MITRKALLIGASGSGRGFLPGVAVDLKTMKNFLLSPQGGAWKESEITVLFNPKLETIFRVQDSMQATYTFSHFSGHGFEDPYGNRFLQLSNGDYFQDTDLLNSSPKQLVFADSCRTVIRTGISGLSEIGDPFEHLEAEIQLKKARALYNRWIQVTKPGKVIIHSTSSDTYAYDTDNGGVFTQKIIELGQSVPQREKFNLSGSYKVFQQASVAFKKGRYPQVPNITYSSGNINLPFALSLSPVRQNRQIPRSKGQGAAGWLLALTVLGLALSSSDEE